MFQNFNEKDGSKQNEISRIEHVNDNQITNSNERDQFMSLER